MMLRESARHLEIEPDIGAVLRSTTDPRVPLGREILAFVDAAVLGDDHELPVARAELLDRSDRAAVVAVAAVAANFQMMNRLLDATGAPVRGRHSELADELGVVVPVHLRER